MINPKRLPLLILAIEMSIGSVFCACAQEPWLPEKRRLEMVKTQIEQRGVRDPRVLAAMRTVPRHLFVRERYAKRAYSDQPLPIGHGQTISQPYVVAYMTEALDPRPQERILEIGTGSGYQAAILSLLAGEVYTIEIVRELAEAAEEKLQQLGYENVRVKWGDGYKGWPEKAPFDGIMVTAAPPEIPEALIDQLRIGGRMIVPVGEVSQELVRVTRTEDGIRTETLLPVLFVPMVHGEEDRKQ